MEKIVRLTESDLVRIVKRVINEQTNENGWTAVYEGLKSFGNPKTTTYTYKEVPVTEISWSKNSPALKEKNKLWSLSLGSNNRITFTTTNNGLGKVFENVMGFKTVFNPTSRQSSYSGPMDFSNPNDVVQTIQKLIKSLG